MRPWLCCAVVSLFVAFAASASLPNHNINVAHSEEDTLNAVKGLFSRVMPQYSQYLSAVVISAPNATAFDYFEVETVNGYLQLRGTSGAHSTTLAFNILHFSDFLSLRQGVAIASALNWFLKNKCNSLVTWQDSSVSCPTPFPVVSPVYASSTPHKWRYYFNVCTCGYTSAFWDWKRWEREIDWMSLNGINMPLAFNGQEILWQQVYSELGVSQKGLDDFFTGPAFLPWQRMGNVNKWMGPLSSAWMSSDSALQKLILQRERAFGMSPVLPAFAGHVPGELSKLFPTANITKSVGWGTFNETYGTFYLSPTDALFSKIGTRFVELVNQVYGSDHFYNADPFNEVRPPSSDPAFIAQSAQVIYNSMAAADPSAVWVLQGWFLVNDATFWQPPQAKAFLDAIPSDNLLVLDLFAEIQPEWQATKNFYDRPFIWNMLHNFGGRTGFYASLPRLASGPFNAMNAAGSTMVGMGLTPEATETNYVVYDLWSDIVWMPASSPAIDLTNWLITYSNRRYNAAQSQNMRAITAAWTNLLGPGVYSSPTNQEGTSGSLIAARPAFDLVRVGCCAVVAEYYKGVDNWRALGKFLEHPITQSNEPYLNDLAELTRQVLSDATYVQWQRLENAYHAKDTVSLNAAGSMILTYINYTEAVLASRPLWLVGNWIAAARAKGSSPSESDLFEVNARTQVTLWGPRDSGLHEYAYKLWSGLVGDLYSARWQLFIAQLQSSLKTGVPFDQNAFDQAVMDLDLNWTLSKKVYPTTPSGASTINIAQQAYLVTSNIW
jgi:alpha-N-acetylglucosaminidase